MKGDFVEGKPLPVEPMFAALGWSPCAARDVDRVMVHIDGAGPWSVAVRSRPGGRGDGMWHSRLLEWGDLKRIAAIMDAPA